MPGGPVTIGDLKRTGQLLEVYCDGCARHLSLDPGSLTVEDAQPVPTLAPRLRCTVCGARNDAIRFPVWCRPDARVRNASGKVWGG